MAELAITAARFLGRSRKLALFGGLVAVAGVVNELQKRREAQWADEDQG
jgi:hypothetical protein